MDERIGNENDIGEIKISEEVVAVVAGIATSEVKGVAGMAGTIAGGIAEILGKKNLSKGIKVDLRDETVSVDLHIIVNYGSKVPEVAWEIQEKVKKAIECMVGLTVEKVNIFIEGVNIEKEPRKETRPPKPDAETDKELKDKEKAEAEPEEKQQ